jgi:3-isopropylmalate/(R)-2-methylmalate dehydratase small subunit
VTMTVRGRTWVFPEPNVNTDLMMPAALFRLPRSQQAGQLFGEYRPGWASSVQMNDILIGGRNFGTGSSRPAPALMADLGIRAVVAVSLNGLFFRNCINHGVAASECPAILDLVREPDEVAFDVARGTITNVRTGAAAQGTSLPAELIAVLNDGGILPRLIREGYVSAPSKERETQ